MSRTIGKTTFLETLNASCQIAGSLGEAVIRRDKNSYSSEKTNAISNIKKEAVGYKKSVKAVKEVAGIRSLLGNKKSELLDMAEGQARSTIDRVSGYKTLLTLATEKLINVTENEKDVAESRKHADEEFESVRKLYKSGFIEKIRYESGKGLFWTYPPTVYQADNTYFLGRPEAGLSQVNTDGFSVKLPSYPTGKDIGTYHMRHSDAGSDYCLGGFGDVLKVLAAKRQVTSIIRMFKSYFLSYNATSRHNIPPIGLMSIDLPQVTDDSWIEWKKKHPNYKIKPVAVAVAAVAAAEEEPCGDCGELPCEC